MTRSPYLFLLLFLVVEPGISSAQTATGTAASGPGARPELPRSAASQAVRDDCAKRLHEVWKVHGEIKDIENRHPSTQGRLAELHTLEKQYQNHPAMASILVAMGDAFIDQPAEAAVCYERAARYPVSSDPLGLDQQLAWQHLAALYERQKEYKKAVGVLESWQIRGDCGNGVEAEELRRRIWMLRLRKEYEPKDKVEAELWDWLRGKRMFLGTPDEVVRQIRLFYGDQSLHHRLKGEEGQLPARSPAPEAFHPTDFARILEALREQETFEQRLKTASWEELLRLVADETRRDQQYKAYLHATDPNLRYHRASLLIQELLARGKHLKPLLMTSVMCDPNSLTIYALGRIGGKEAVQALAAKAFVEEYPDPLRDLYYALMLTGTAEATAIVKEAADTGQGNHPTAARQAMEAYESTVRATGRT